MSWRPTSLMATTRRGIAIDDEKRRRDGDCSIGNVRKADDMG